MKCNFKIIAIIAIFFVCVSLIVLSLCLANRKNSDISESDFIQYVNEGDSVVIYFWQESCGSCQTLRPIVNEISAELNIDLFFLNADMVSDDFWNKWNIRCVPSIIIIDNGNVEIYDDFSTNNDIVNILGGANSFTFKDRPTSIVELEYGEFLNKMGGKDDFILFVGRPDCKDCMKFFPILDNYVAEHNKGLYYFNIKQLRDQSLSENNPNNDEYKEIVEMLGLQWVPTIFRISSGRVVSKYSYLCPDYYKLESDAEKKAMEDEYYTQFIKWMNSVQ